MSGPLSSYRWKNSRGMPFVVDLRPTDRQEGVSFAIGPSGATGFRRAMEPATLRNIPMLRWFSVFFRGLALS